jgi:hypothetical protein
MNMIPWAKPCQFSRYAWAVRHKASWFEHGSKLASDASDSAGHAKLAHVRLNPLHIVVRQ